MESLLLYAAGVVVISFDVLFSSWWSPSRQTLALVIQHQVTLLTRYLKNKERA